MNATTLDKHRAVKAAVAIVLAFSKGGQRGPSLATLIERAIVDAVLAERKDRRAIIDEALAGRQRADELLVAIVPFFEQAEWATRSAAENQYCPSCAPRENRWDDQLAHAPGCVWVALKARLEEELRPVRGTNVPNVPELGEPDPPPSKGASA